MQIIECPICGTPCGKRYPSTEIDPAFCEAQTYDNERRQQKANARLITAAPEMAKMLRGKVLAALRQPQAMDIEGVCEDVEELLKKAGVL